MPDTPLATPTPATADKNVAREKKGWAFGLPEAGAVAAGNAVGGVVSSTTGLIGLLTTGELWKGVGLILAGVLILLFAAKEILNITAVPVPV